MSLGLLGDSAGSLEEEKNIIQRAAQGETPGATFGVIEQDDITKAEQVGPKMDGKYKSTKVEPLISGCAYGHALERDIKYASFGRKYMRCTSFNNRMVCAYNRALLLAWLEKASSG